MSIHDAAPDGARTGRSQPASRLRIVRASTPEDRAAVLSLRYQVFVEELGYVVPGTDPAGGLADAGDDRAFLLVGYDGGIPAGTIAVDWWGDGEMPPSRVAEYQLNEFAGVFGRRSVFLFRKTAVAPRYRRSLLFMTLVRQASEYVYGHPDARFAFLEASPYLVTFYERLGFRRYAPHFVYDHGGALGVPLCMVVDDQEHLARVRSPILPLLRRSGRPEHPGARRFFEE